MISACIFCRIAAKDLPAEIKYEDDQLIAFPDIRPKAPIHLLIIPKEHQLASIADMQPEQASLIGKLLMVAKQLAEQQGIDRDGYRLIFNVRRHGGQEVDHIHLHLLGGEPLGPIRSSTD